MASITWGSEIAQVYDETYAAGFDRAVLDPMVDVLADLARGGPVVEFAVGTGRAALALAERGVPVHGIELSPHMVERMQTKPGAASVPVSVGDMTTTRLAGTFELVYLVANTIMNVTTQEEQLAVFENAAAHLGPRGCFVVEVVVPQVRQGRPGTLRASSGSSRTTSESRRLTTKPSRSRGRTTGCTCRVALSGTPRHTATSGRPS